MIHGLEPKERNLEAERQLSDYWLARVAGRLGWSLAQIKLTGPDIALLCERLGWRGSEGFEHLQELPRQTVDDWLVMAEMEREKEKRAN